MLLFYYSLLFYTIRQTLSFIEQRAIRACVHIAGFTCEKTYVGIEAAKPSPNSPLENAASLTSFNKINSPEQGELILFLFCFSDNFHLLLYFSSGQ